MVGGQLDFVVSMIPAEWENAKKGGPSERKVPQSHN